MPDKASILRFALLDTLGHAVVTWIGDPIQAKWRRAGPAAAVPAGH
jgi:hypothetical protein